MAPKHQFLPPFLSPLLLQTALGPFRDVGSDLTADGLVFRNPNRTGMIVDQIRFSGDAASSHAKSCAMAIEVTLGSIPLTKGLVTLATLAPGYLGLQGGLDSNVILKNPNVDSMLTWHMLKPLYVPPGVPLIIRGYRQEVLLDTTQPGSITRLGIAVAARSLPADFVEPKEIDVPWVAETKYVGHDTRVVSKDSDLANPHDVPVNVRQFIGANYTDISGGQIFNVNPANLTVQMTASNGMMFIRDPTPFFAVFPSERGVLNVEARLQPGEFFRSELEIASLPAGSTANLDRIEFTSIAMHGYRRVPCPQGVPTP